MHLYVSSRSALPTLFIALYRALFVPLYLIPNLFTTHSTRCPSSDPSRFLSLSLVRLLLFSCSFPAASFSIQLLSHPIPQLHFHLISVALYNWVWNAIEEYTHWPCRIQNAPPANAMVSCIYTCILPLTMAHSIRNGTSIPMIAKYRLNAIIPVTYQEFGQNWSSALCFANDFSHIFAIHAVPAQLCQRHTSWRHSPHTLPMWFVWTKLATAQS